MLGLLAEFWQPLLALSVLFLFWTWESFAPFFRPSGLRLRHATRNLTVALLNGLVLATVFAGLTVAVAVLTEDRQLGLLNALGLNPSVHAVAAFLLLDCWTYGWHRINHRVPFLWRFHRMHHSDPAMDVTTATRFHLGEISFSSALRLALIPLLGIPLWTLIVYDTMLLGCTQFHHANIQLPARLDTALRYAIVTPNMHKVHHSRLQPETDSNFSSLLSVWDRLFASYREKPDYSQIRFGLDGYDDDARQSVKGLLLTPILAPDRPGSKPLPQFA
jgi:sterol desaturase/sphingolipid hydroxylase (fatty acid hydroxylase superfamily)